MSREKCTRYTFKVSKTVVAELDGNELKLLLAAIRQVRHTFAIADAQSNQTTHQELVSQAKDLRQPLSGVSLDAEAIKVLEFQRSYQAVSKMVTILDQLTQTVVNMIQ